MSPMKNEGLSYPTHFLKIWGSDIRKNFHEIKNKTSQYMCATKRNSFIIHHKNSKSVTQ